MIVTENEASGKWCPFARASYHTTSTPSFPAEEGYLGNRDCNNGNIPNTDCIGSGCMAWRWQPLLADEAFGEAVRKAAEEIGDTAPQRTKAAKHVKANLAKYGLPTEPFQGFCGLAGKPIA